MRNFKINPITGQFDLVGDSSTPVDNDYITFNDPVVEAICVQNWGLNGKLTYSQAAKVISLNYRLENNSNIISFDEFKHFHNINSFSFEFWGCRGLETITLPHNIINIGSSSFSDCIGLLSIIIPTSVIQIGQWAFARSGLESIDIPDNVIIIRELAFANCLNLSYVNLSPGVKTIPLQCFVGCTALNYVNMGSVEVIGGGSFQNCSSLESVDIPGSIKLIESGAFDYCTNLKVITIYADIPPKIEGTFLESIFPTYTIKVPVNSVDAYKSAPVWSNHSEHILANDF